MNLITPTEAANRLSTNINVINRWIEQGHISVRQTEAKGYLIEEDKFDRLCQDIRDWLGEDDTDEDGVIRVSVGELEQFWREQRGRLH